MNSLLNLYRETLSIYEGPASCLSSWLSKGGNLPLKPYLWTHSSSSTEKPSPSIKYHRQARKSYLLVHGERSVDKLESFAVIPKLCCITDLIWSMINEGEDLIKGSLHEDNFFIFRDALVLMTSKETIKWMIQKG